nr:hypothetical protein [Tanacetum cinerariifolium]
MAEEDQPAALAITPKDPPEGMTMDQLSEDVIVITMSEYLRFPFTANVSIRKRAAIPAKEKIVQHTIPSLLVDQNIPDKTKSQQRVEVDDAKVLAAKEKKKVQAAKAAAKKKETPPVDNTLVIHSETEEDDVGENPHRFGQDTPRIEPFINLSNQPLNADNEQVFVDDSNIDGMSHPSSNPATHHDRSGGVSLSEPREILRVIIEYFLKISKKARILKLKRRNMKNTVLTTNTPYPSRKIRRMCACTSQETTKNQSPIRYPEQEFCLSRKLFKTLSLDESISPMFDLISDLEENSEEEVTETMSETMEEYMSKTQADYGSGGAIPTKTVADAKVAVEEMVEYSQKWHNKTSKARSTKTSNGLAAIQAQLNNLGREIKKVNEKVIIRASISAMPLSTYLNLGLGKLAHTNLTVELAYNMVKPPKGIAENVLVGIGKFIFLVDFIILDMPEDVKVPLILGRPFLSTAHARIYVFKRKITLRVGDEKIIFKSVKPASSLIKRVYVLSLRERMELNLEARLMGET